MPSSKMLSIQFVARGLSLVLKVPLGCANEQTTGKLQFHQANRLLFHYQGNCHTVCIGRIGEMMNQILQNAEIG